MTRSELERYFHQQIPLTAAMGLTVTALEDGCIRLSAPLAPNRNDKGTAFGGSLASLLTLAGWGLLHVKLEHLGLESDVVIQKSEFLYNHPVRGEVAAYCDLPTPAEWDRFIGSLRRRGKSRIVLTSWIAGPGNAAVTMEGRYVATTRSEPTDD